MFFTNLVRSDGSRIFFNFLTLKKYKVRIEIFNIFFQAVTHADFFILLCRHVFVPKNSDNSNNHLTFKLKYLTSFYKNIYYTVDSTNRIIFNAV